MVFGEVTRDGDIHPATWPRTYIQGEVDLSASREGLLEDFTFDAMSHKQENPVLAATISHLACYRLIPRYQAPWFCVGHGWARDQPNSVQHQKWTERSIHQFNLRIPSKKSCRRFWSRLEAVVEANGNFFE